MTQPRKFQRLIDVCCELPPMVTAVVHPCDAAAIEAAIEAARLGLIRPILVGPEARIRAAARKASLELDRDRKSTRLNSSHRL